MKIKKHWSIALAGLVALGLGGCGSKHSEEHTEKSTSGGEHPAEHPTESTSGGVSTAELAKAIENHVNKTASGGAFTIKHPDTKEGLSLTLDKIHIDRLQQTGPNTYFACADFKGSDGKMYDLDFWVKGTAGKLTVTETMLHKEQGKERYSWFEDETKGVWMQKFAGKAGNEHPKGEHPKKKSLKKEHPKK